MKDKKRKVAFSNGFSAYLRKHTETISTSQIAAAEI